MSRNLEAFCINPTLTASRGGLNVGDLIEELRMRGLETSGNRSELAARLCSALKGATPPSPAPVNVPINSPPPPAPVKGASKVPINSPPSRAQYITKEEDQLKVVTQYDPKRHLINLSGPILRTVSDFVKTGIEYGGMIDINTDGTFDRSIFGIGYKRRVPIDDMLDFEVIYHTHPVGRTDFMFEPPSSNDLILSLYTNYERLLSSKYQVHIVFTPEGVYTIYFTNIITPTIPKIREISDAYNKYVGMMGDYNKLIERLEAVTKYGIYIFRYSKYDDLDKLHPDPIDNWPKSIPLYIDPMEPVITLTTRRSRSQTAENKRLRQIEQQIERIEDAKLAEGARLLRSGRLLAAH